MSDRRNEYLDAGFSDSDHEEGYDSEAAEYSKARTKRRKLSSPEVATTTQAIVSENEETDVPAVLSKRQLSSPLQSSTKASRQPSKPAKTLKPGVVYLSSLPPYLKPSALRNLLTQRGFSPITRLFLAPTSKAKNHHSSKKSSRQLYSEGWIEFASKKTAKRCAETLNATTVGGRKGGFYHDDIWNMKYLRGVGWDDLMAQVREERREEEVRRTEERRQIARETKEFIEGVERGKVARGIDRSRKKQRLKSHAEEVETEDVRNGVDDSAGRRMWRQYKVKESGGGGQAGDSAAVKDDVKRVLSKIF
jgi:ESF2/ABP1 family protein